MSSRYGKKVEVNVFGQSHSEAIGVVIDGLPAGIKIDMDLLNDFMKRRAPGQNRLTTQRKEEDSLEILSGIVDDTSCGAPISIIIRNRDMRSKDYSSIKDSPRPSHADFPAHIKHGGYEDYRGGGHFSGRLTGPLCIAGGIFIQIMEKYGVKIRSRIVEIGGNSEDPISEVEKAKMDLDSVGGIIECVVEGLPVGLGDPMFDGIENRISQAIFAVGGVKGIEFGAGFSAARMRGSQHNDEFVYEGDRVVTKTNNHGGILGGLTTGMPVVFRVAIKPTPSIFREQESVSYSKKENVIMSLEGRHDPCIVLRARPCIESACAIALIDYFV